MHKNYFVILLVCCALAILVLSGCAEPVRYPEVVSELPSAEVLVQRQIVGTSVDNRPIECIMLGQGPDVIFILATIHGNEPAGTPLVRQLSKYLQQNTQLLTGKKVVLLPVANPDGLYSNSRFNANGVNLNRNFATDNRINKRKFGYKALSEPETRTIEKLISKYKPDRIVSIHQPLACIDYDGSAYSLANEMAQHCELPIKKLGAKPGSLGSYAGLTLGIPIVTFEMFQNDSSLNDDVLWQRYGAALLSAITYPQTFTLE